MPISSSSGGLSIKVLTRAAGCCRRLFIISWIARQIVRCSRTHQIKAVGGHRLETRVFWSYGHTAQEESRFCSSSKSVRGLDALSINVLERLGMVLSSFILVSSCADRRSATVDCALLRGDNEAAVHFVRRCRGNAGTALRWPHATPRRSQSVIRMTFRANACAWYPQRCCQRYLSQRSRLRF